jgi:anionic cell wall polymer biosynthesis LytR-Cps2A-Psr (LCP) family protein
VQLPAARQRLPQGPDARELIAFGTDAHIGGENRSDTIILVHTRPDRKEVVFLSFPRDLWVDIPGMGEGKINSAFEGGVNGGGAQRVARTLRSISGMQIHTSSTSTSSASNGSSTRWVASTCACPTR